MLSPDELTDALRHAGIDFASGVPCSILTGLAHSIAATPGISHVPATHEGEALAIAAGAGLAGRTPLVYLQNSGLGNTVNPLTSLIDPLALPLFMIVTWRGAPGEKDEPQHRLMGEITRAQLDLLEIENEVMPAEPIRAATVVRRLADSAMSRSKPVALVVKSGTIAPAKFDYHATPPTQRQPNTLDLREGKISLTRARAIECLSTDLSQDTAFISTTGKTGRELFTIAESARNLYCVGAMGHASAVGLGVSLNANRPVAVLDGDGAALMKLGNFATIGAFAKSNLLHIVLDNGVHDSTGGQQTVSAGVNFAAIAVACGYAKAVQCDSLTGLRQAVATIETETSGPKLLHVRILAGSMPNLGRPTIPPAAVADRFRNFLGAVAHQAPAAAVPA